MDKRYEPANGAIEMCTEKNRKTGKFVLYSDYEKLEADLKTAEMYRSASVESYKKMADRCDKYIAMHKRLALRLASCEATLKEIDDLGR